MPRVVVELAEYRAMEEAQSKAPLKVDFNPICMIDELVYLGFRMQWRWNWVKA